jgi:Domain of unknown function (DUF1857)
MHFEHLVEINDPLQPLLPEVTREQLWRGLVRRAERPTEFVLALQGAQVGEPQGDGAVVERVRELDFGNFRVRDRVRLHAGQRSETFTEAGSGFAASRLTIAIEEPAPLRLYLRFTYHADSEASPIDETARRLREQAYKSADIDTVWRIRDLAERGELG